MIKTPARVQALSPFNTPEISDALDACGVEGALLHIKPLILGKKLIGPAYTVQYKSYTNACENFRSASDYIDNVPTASVIVIDNDSRVDCTVWGGILTQAARLKGISGTIVNGAVRDAHQIQDAHYPVFCLDQYMRSGKNRVYKSQEQCPLMINGVTIYPGDIIFADDHGVLVIPIQRLDDIIDKAQNIQSTEKKITTALQAGERLDHARAKYRYDQPWLKS